LALPGDAVVLVAAVRVAGRVGVVLEQVDVTGDALIVQPLLRLDQQTLEDPLTGAVVNHQIADRVTLGSGVFGMRTHVEIQPGPVAQEDVARPPPRHDPAEKVTGHLVRRQPPLPTGGTRDSVLGLQAEDPPVHVGILAVAARRWPFHGSSRSPGRKAAAGSIRQPRWELQDGPTRQDMTAREIVGDEKAEWRE